MHFVQRMKGWFKWFGTTTTVSQEDGVPPELTPTAEYIPLFELGTGVFDTYINTVKKRNYYTLDYVQKKLTRNVLLAKALDGKKNGQTLYLYGNLELLVVENTIVWIRNNKKNAEFDSRRRGWKKNYAEHKRLGALLGL